MKIIDSHVHVWDPGVLDYGWLANNPDLNRPFLPQDLPHTPADTLATVFVQADCRDNQGLKEVDWVASLGSTWPSLGAIVAFAPVSSGDRVAEDLGHLLQRPLVRGVRQLLQGRDESFVLHPDMLAGARCVADAGLVFDACIRSGQLATLAAFADAAPGLQIVLDHMGKPPIASGALTEWSTGMRELARRSNVVVKISGAGAESDRNRPPGPQALPYIKETLHLFGADRCMLGSDWPVSLTGPATYKEWITTAETALAGATASERASVSSGTAAGVYRLAESTGGATTEARKQEKE
ncbi:amidohydrolase [Arthrobacter sp. BB-1]|uniref:amidohydrolase family protein n=1 Tax=unclassified Arthrobacter TaxID=235627 RepID=UPI0010D2AB5E|nr:MULTISPECIES: amidohydrolase family protein [unclassified Arthrobacter]TNB74586.1 amidohydrolase [Arthrobacter sp. BB-1]VII94935.1 L-fuconolactone hydrolase [Arthrobacter sp. DR-2P]